MMARVSRRNRKRLVSEINVVPYIDVMLVLLVIFMVTAPMLTPGVAIDLPSAEGTPNLPTDTNNETVTIYVNDEGQLFIDVGGDLEEPVSLNIIKDRVFKITQAKPNTNFQIRASEKVPYSVIAPVMVDVSQAGGTRLGFVIERD